MDILQINKLDNVAVALTDLTKGKIIQIDEHDIILKENIPAGHKIALKNINKDEQIIKYSFSIGHATDDIIAGSHVHTHNLKTNLGKILNYSYKPTKISNLPKIENCTFKGYQRENGDVGIRNNLWIVPTVNCVTSTVRYLEKIGKELII